MKNRGKLHITGMPIGNYEDISLRALSILKTCDFLICETRKEAAKFFKYHNIEFPRDRWMEINEHSGHADITEALEKIQSCEISVLISDSGMPVICDPGSELVRKARSSGIEIVILPGPTALTSALALAGINTNRGFQFMGFPPQKTEERMPFLKNILSDGRPAVIYETPYRLKKLLDEIHKTLPKDKNIFIAVDLSMQSEFIFQGKVKSIPEIINKIEKGAPVVILH